MHHVNYKKKTQQFSAPTKPLMTRLDNDEFSESHCSVAYKIRCTRMLRVHIVKINQHRSKSNAELYAGLFTLITYILRGEKQMRTQECRISVKNKKHKMKLKEIPYPKQEYDEKRRRCKVVIKQQLPKPLISKALLLSKSLKYFLHSCASLRDIGSSHCCRSGEISCLFSVSNYKSTTNMVQRE